MTRLKQASEEPRDRASPQSRVIALVDWHTKGHSKTYMHLFAQALLEMGHRVIIFWPSPKDFRDLQGQAGEDRLLVVGFRRPPNLIFWSRETRYRARARKMSIWLKEHLNACEERLGARCDLVFFNWLYDKQIEMIAPLADTCARPWSCLYLQVESLPPHPRKNARVLKLLQHKDLHAIGVLDERTVVEGERITGRRIIQFPDMADETREVSHPYEKKLRDFADGRPLTLIIGHLLKRKGLAALAKAALSPEAKDLRFAFVGEYRMSGKEGKMLKKTMRDAPNVLFKLGYLPDEASYNACVQAADVLFAAYLDFAHSSNTLTKAAIFEKPLIVSDGHLMAERVRRFRMGEVVEQGNSKEILGAIHKIMDDRSGWLAENKPDWEEYREQHSFQALKEALTKTIEASLPDDLKPASP